MDPLYDVIIIGSGPAAHTAAVYTARAQLKTLVLEGMMANDVAAGGQLTMTTDVENFPGFPEGIMGAELTERFRAQSAKMGAVLIEETVVDVEKTVGGFLVRTEVGCSVYGRAVIVATGAKAKRLEFPGSETYWNKGISACAVCDGAAPIFRGRPVAVVGGGDTAMEEALFLTKYASVVYVVHRRDSFRASKVMQERVRAHPKIQILWNREVEEATGDERGLLGGVRLKSTISGGEEEIGLDVAGLFFAIGHEPASVFLKGLVATDEHGYILTDGHTRTSVPGLFAAGDVQDKEYRQAITAAGSGCMAALEAERWLAHATEI